MAKKSGFFTEFKKFISRGNVVDLAVGMIVGSAFTAIVNSLVKDIIMPVTGLLVGGMDFTQMKIVLKAATETTEAVTLNYGNFIQYIVNFLIVAFSVFVMVKVINGIRDRAMKKEEAEVAAAAAAAAAAPAEPPKPSDEVVLLTEIRDLLSKK